MEITLGYLIDENTTFLIFIKKQYINYYTMSAVYILQTTPRHQQGQLRLQVKGLPLTHMVVNRLQMYQPPSVLQI